MTERKTGIRPHNVNRVDQARVCRWPELDVITIGGTPTWGNDGLHDQHATTIAAPS
jgi:hypothetical protein